MAQLVADARAELIETIETLDTRLRWLSAWTVHNANHIREKRDGLKVGGHQASCSSMTAIMAALYFHALRPQDKVAVKPHAGPVLQAPSSGTASLSLATITALAPESSRMCRWSRSVLVT